MFKGVNNRIVDMEISGDAALPTPEYIIYGTRGSLIAEGNVIRLKYPDPEVPLAKVEAAPSTPDGAFFGNNEVLVWKEETITLSGKDKTDVIWDYFYDTYRNHKPYPITPDQAAEVVRVLENVKTGTEFAR